MKKIILSLSLLFTSLSFAAPLDLVSAVSSSNEAQIENQIKSDLQEKLDSVFGPGFNLDGFSVNFKNMQCHETNSILDQQDASDVYGVCFVEGGKIQVIAKYVLVVSAGKVTDISYVDHAVE